MLLFVRIQFFTTVLLFLFKDKEKKERKQIVKYMASKTITFSCKDLISSQLFHTFQKPQSIFFQSYLS
jgi:hypothetical protein